MAVVVCCHMPLIDKLDRLGALQETGRLTPEEFQQTKETLLSAISTSAATSITPTAQVVAQRSRKEILADIARVDHVFEHQRKQWMVHGRYSALKEPTAGHYVYVVFWAMVWIILCGMAIIGFASLNRMLAIFPAGTLFVGLIFMVHSILNHSKKIRCYRAAKLHWQKRRAALNAELAGS